METADPRSNDGAWRQEHVQEPTGSRKSRRRSRKEIPQENSEKQPDHTFKVIKTLNLLDQKTKKLTSQVTDPDGQIIADTVKVNDTIEELDLAKNTKSSKKYKVAVDESAETVEKAKTTINNIVMYYHNEVTHPDEVHEECAVQIS